jgi:hypothetical protein
MTLKLNQCTLKIMYGRFVGNGINLLAINSDYILKSHCTGCSTHWIYYQYNQISPDILHVTCSTSITTLHNHVMSVYTDFARHSTCNM